MSQENQHYVPKFMLRMFSNGKKPKVFVFDKSNDNEFHSNVKNLASETGFYELDVVKKIFSAESDLSKLEDKASGIIKRLIENKDLSILTKQEILLLSVFFAVQFVRTKEHRLKFEKVSSVLEGRFRDMGANEKQINEAMGYPEEVDSTKLFGLQSISDVSEYTPHFLNKTWLLYNNETDKPFYTSDNPVTLYNRNEYGISGNLGLGVKGIEMYIPLSPSLCLSIACPSILEKIISQNAEIIDDNGLLCELAAEVLGKDTADLADILTGFRTGASVQVKEENVKMMNSLQVIHSSRQIYSSNGDFSLAKEMIKSDVSYRSGLGIKII
jgi:hypothetical protein